MLSRVAERLYWASRYLERIENTARLVDVYDKLLFDLPRGVDFDWYQLVTINSAEVLFGDRYKIQDERNVVKFLLGDTTNPASVQACLQCVRENVRTTRDVIPADAWELINELHRFVEDNIQQGINRSKRFEFLQGVIKGCQQINGLLHTMMPRDAAWEFMQLGRKLERADMTTRLLDAGCTAHMHLADDDTAVNQHQLIWGNVLRSLGAHSSYLRTTRATVSSTQVVNYLLYDRSYPAAISHCFDKILDACEHLPNNKGPVQKVRKAQKTFLRADHQHQIDQALREYLNELQLELASGHGTIATQWFSNHY
ncbi:putative protein [BD1-7 clade bacterium]|uniref:DUF403 domain-containing protein n=1 Tax=BD1-7 clade bacterium TaxID=2029982 RepID=A0A5S9MR92_9GAMM|nr:putative protein [BD1-7 clade bacterium]